MMTLDDMIEVLQGMKDGKQIQFNNPKRDDKWAKYVNHLKSTGFALYSDMNYRVKPEPREFVIAYDKVSGAILSAGYYQNGTLVQLPITTKLENTATIRVREVVD